MLLRSVILCSGVSGTNITVRGSQARLACETTVSVEDPSAEFTRDFFRLQDDRTLIQGLVGSSTASISATSVPAEESSLAFIGKPAAPSSAESEMPRGGATISVDELDCSSAKFPAGADMVDIAWFEDSGSVKTRVDTATVSNQSHLVYEAPGRIKQSQTYIKKDTFPRIEQTRQPVADTSRAKFRLHYYLQACPSGKVPA